MYLQRKCSQWPSDFKCLFLKHKKRCCFVPFFNVLPSGHKLKLMILRISCFLHRFFKRVMSDLSEVMSITLLNEAQFLIHFNESIWLSSSGNQCSCTNFRRMFRCLPFSYAYKNFLGSSQLYTVIWFTSEGE